MSQDSVIGSGGGGGGGGFNWVIVTSISPTNPIQIVKNHGYICDGVAQVTFVLPLSPGVGTEFAIVSNTATFRINQNGAQQIRVGASITTAGSGFITSNTVGDVIQGLYVGGNLFISMAPQGTLTLN